MNDFKQFAEAIKHNVDTLQEEHDTLYNVSVTKDEIITNYMRNLPEDEKVTAWSNKKHDCNCCKAFLRNLSGMVAIVDGKLKTIWEISIPDNKYQATADAMDKYIKSHNISDVFIRSEKKYGKLEDTQVVSTLVKSSNEVDNLVKVQFFSTLKQSTYTFNHFQGDINRKFLSSNSTRDISLLRSNATALENALKIFSIGALETVIELAEEHQLAGVEGNSLENVKLMLELKRAYEITDNQHLFIWSNVKSPVVRMKNSSIGVLICDLSEDKNLEESVLKYRKIVDPANYQKSSKVVTKAMLNKAKALVEEKGLSKSLGRRLATLADVSVNDVLFANGTASAVMQDSPFDAIEAVVASNSGPFTVPDNVPTITIADFIDKIPDLSEVYIVPGAEHRNNFMSITTAKDLTAPNLFKWDNPFGYTYVGNLAGKSSITEAVAAVGAKTDGVMRMSLIWNEEGNSTSCDLDLHCKSPRNHIYYGNKCDILDYDNTHPGNKVAVENMIWVDTPADGSYDFYIRNFSGRNGDGFRAELVIEGNTFTYTSGNVTSDVKVATVTIKNGIVKSIEHKLPFESTYAEVYGIQTGDLHRVTSILNSPNYWGENKVGKEHIFFIIENCKTDERINGFHTEFLRADLYNERKVFGLLADSLRCDVADDQLSGLGFSKTERAEVLIKTIDKNNKSNLYKVTF